MTTAQSKHLLTLCGVLLGVGLAGVALFGRAEPNFPYVMAGGALAAIGIMAGLIHFGRDPK